MSHARVDIHAHPDIHAHLELRRIMPSRPARPNGVPFLLSALTALLPLLMLLVGPGVEGVSAQGGGSQGTGSTARGAAGDTIIPLPSLDVTILRTPMELGTAPFAISVVGETDLRRGKSGVSLEEALQGLPGVQLQNRFNYAVGERISVRGFGARSQFGVRGIRMHVDGIPATLPDGQSTLDHLDPASLGRVEALRGPASALYGNAAGGVLLFESRAPSDQPLEQEFRAVSGSHGLLNVRSTTSGTAGETGYLVDLSHLSYDGFRTNPQSTDGATYGKATRLYLNGRVLHPLGRGQLAATVNFADMEAENPGSLSQVLLDGDTDRPAFGFNVVQGAGKTVRQGQAGLTWTGPVPVFGGLEGELTAYGIMREFENPIPNVIIDLDRRAGGARALLGNGGAPAGATGAGAFGWTGGVDFGFQRDARLNLENEQGEPGALVLDQSERVRSIGVFLQTVHPVTDRLRVMAGLRHDQLRFEVDDHFPVEADDPDDSGSRMMSAFSPSIGAHFDVSPALGIFGNVATSFESPTTTELANRPEGSGGFNPELDPQEGVTFEAGARGRSEGTAGLAYELVIFHTRLSNELVSFEVPDAPGRSFYRNSGASERTGVEGSLLFTPVPALTTRLTYTWTEAEFREYQVGPDDLSGNVVPGLAPHRVEGLVRVGAGALTTELRAEHTARIVVDDQNEFRSPDYTLLDLRVSGSALPLPLRGVRVDPFLGISNLLDERYNASVTVNAFGQRYFEPGPGRTFYVGASVSGALGSR